MVQKSSSGRVTPAAEDLSPVPVASMVEIIVGCEWSVRLLELCDEGHLRPSAFLRACPGLSAKVGRRAPRYRGISGS